MIDIFDYQKAVEWNRGYATPPIKMGYELHVAESLHKLIAAPEIESLQSEIARQDAVIERLGKKESMELQILIGDVPPKFDYKSEYFTRIQYARDNRVKRDE